MTLVTLHPRVHRPALPPESWRAQLAPSLLLSLYKCHSIRGASGKQQPPSQPTLYLLESFLPLECKPCETETLLTELTAVRPAPRTVPGTQLLHDYVLVE